MGLGWCRFGQCEMVRWGMVWTSRFALGLLLQFLEHGVYSYDAGGNRMGRLEGKRKKEREIER